MSPLTHFRDWWHRPVLDRLDAIAEKLAQPEPQFYELGVDKTVLEPEAARAYISAAMDRISLREHRRSRL